MSLSALGKNTSPIEVTHVSNHGVWLLAVSDGLARTISLFFTEHFSLPPFLLMASQPVE